MDEVLPECEILFVVVSPPLHTHILENVFHNIKS